MNTYYSVNALASDPFFPSSSFLKHDITS